MNAVLVTIRTPPMEPALLGRRLSSIDLDALAARGIDPGGERGEYHTVVTDCPLFAGPLALRAGRQVDVAGCRAIDLELERPC